MASPSDNPLKRLIGEIHRRSLWQVLGIYAVASWAVLGVVDTLGGALNLPYWFPSFALALLIIGLPVVLATAFVQEGGPGREASDTDPAAAPAGAPSATGLFTWRKTFGGGVLAFALLGFVGTGWVLFGGGMGGGSEIEKSVAVMPCDDQSPAGDQGPLAQGLAEGIINALAQLPDLKVIGINSVVALLEENADIETVAQRLDVATVLECSLQQADNVIRIRPRLVEAATGAVLWSEEIDQPASNVFSIQDQVARGVTDQLQVVLLGGEDTPLVAQGTSVSEAHQAYLRGRYLWSQRTEASLRNAITEFQRAIDEDPSYAEAYSGLADSYLLVDLYSETAEDWDFPTNLEQGLNAAREAVRLAPDLGMARTSLGWGLWNVGEWESAERAFERAIELSPGYATAHHWYGVFLSTSGLSSEAIAQSRQALELDPISRVISSDLGGSLWRAGRTEDAIEQFRETVRLAPGWATGWMLLSEVLLESGEYDEGLEAYVSFARLLNHDIQSARDAYQAAIRYRETGEPQTLSDLDWNPLHMIQLYAQTGQADQAIGLFGNLVRQGAYGRATTFRQSYISDLLGDDPRYQALLEEAGITW